MNNNRSKSIDTMKGLGILLVLLGHIVPYGSVCSYAIFSFHLPLFLVISGWLFRDDKYAAPFARIRLAVDNLWVYYVFVILGFLRALIDPTLLPAGKRQIFWGVWSIFINGHPFINGPVWFLWVFVLTIVAFSIIRDKVRPSAYILLIAIMYVLSLLIDNLPFAFRHHEVPFMLTSLPLAMMYFLIGYYGRIKFKGKGIGFSGCHNLLLGILCVTCVLVLLPFLKQFNMSVAQVGNWFFPLTSIIGVVGVYFLSNVIDSDVLRWFGRHSKVCFCVDFISLSICAAIISIFEPSFKHYRPTSYISKSWVLALFGLQIVVLALLVPAVERLLKTLNKFKLYGGILFLRALSKPILKTRWYKAKFVDFTHGRYPDNIWYREHDERNFDVVNLGSSGGRWAFDWQSAGVKGMNWANQPQTLIDDFRLLRNFHSILRKNGVVIITIMPFSGLNKTTGVVDTFKYLGTLPWDIVKDMPYSQQAERLRNYPILFGKPAIKAAIRHLLGLEERPSDWRETIERNPMSQEELIKDADSWMAGWSRQFGIDDLEAPLTEGNQEGRKVRIEVMRDIVDFCTERGYRPVYVIPPVSRHLAAKFTSRFRSIYIYDFLEAVNRDVLTLDYLDDADLVEDNLYFNSFFLNAKGRHAFTRRVLQDLQLI